MPTRKQLIDQVRVDQRQKSIVTRANNPKSAIVGIGDRDPLTGQYQVMLSDGSVEMGEKQFNSSLPKGNQVLGVPQSTGGWLLDERDVQPIEPIPQPSTGGKIKILYSQIEGDLRVFYLWGDRPRPKKIGSIPAVGSVFIASIDNRGGNSFVVGVFWATNTAPRIFHSQVMGDKTWVVDEIYDVRAGYDYVGNGFWSKYISGLNIVGGDEPFGIIQPVTKSLYKNQIETYSGSITTTDSSGILLTVIESGTRAIAPNVTRLVSSSLARHIEGEVVITDSYNSSTPFPIVIDKTGKSAVYRVLSGQRVANDNVFSDQYRMITKSSDEVIAGNLPPGQSFISGSPIFGAPYRLGTFVNRKYYITKYDDLSKSTWDVDVYAFSANTTKSTIKAKVTYKSTPDKTFHNASYHP